MLHASAAWRKSRPSVYPVTSLGVTFYVRGAVRSFTGDLSRGASLSARGALAWTELAKCVAEVKTHGGAAADRAISLWLWLHAKIPAVPFFDAVPCMHNMITCMRCVPWGMSCARGIRFHVRMHEIIMVHTMRA